MCRITVITSLFNCQQYLQGYFEAVKQIQNKDEIEILLIHNAPQKEELDIIHEHLPALPFVRHIIIEREGLYATWNRGIKMATGTFIATWNVDDVRLPNSIKDQANALDKHTDAVLAYGDFKIVSSYGSTEGSSVNEPQFDPANLSFQRDFHIGCFPMWRKSIHEKIGFFDEQFRLIADLDFQIRVAKTFKMIKIPQQLGYYLEGTSANLSSNFSIQDKEHTILHLRYGNFNRIYLTYLFNALRNFKIFKYKWFGSYHSMNQWLVEDKWSYISRFPMIIVSVFKLPRHMAKKYIKKHLVKRQQKAAFSTNFL